MPSSTLFQVDTINLFFKPLILSLISNIPQIFFSTWYIWWFFLLIAAIKIGYEIYQFYKLSKAGMFEIDKMTGEQFEERLRILFTNLGYKATRTSSDRVRPDYGADLVIEKDGVRTVVQAKRHNKLIGEDAVRDAYSARNIYGCTEAMVVTNSNFTKMAWRLARSDNVKLWPRNYLVKVLLTEKSLKSQNNLTS